MQLTVNGPEASASYRRQLNRLLQDVFGFDLQRFHDRNLWNEDYLCFSIREQGRMLANAAVYRHKMVCSGREQDWLQLGAVATAPEYRGQGLASQLMAEIEQRFAGTPMFLYANDSVLEFYPKFGFRSCQEYQPWVLLPAGVQKAAVQLSVTDPKIDRYLRLRSQFASGLDCLNGYSLYWFHLLYNYGDSIFEVPDLGALLVIKRDNSVLRLLDVAAAEPLSWDELKPYLTGDGTRKIEFGFTPDWLCPRYDTGLYTEEDSTLMVKNGAHPPPRTFLPRLIIT